MNETCAVCGGFVGNFVYAGEGASVCPGHAAPPQSATSGCRAPSHTWEHILNTASDHYRCIHCGLIMQPGRY